YQHFIHHTTFSNEVSVHDLAEGYRQATDTQKILQLTQNAPAIASYKDIGIYQIFVETDNLDDLNRFIPEQLWILKNENPELLETFVPLLMLIKIIQKPHSVSLSILKRFATASQGYARITTSTSTIQKKCCG